MTLNEFVDRIYCVNLDRRKDRWERSNEIFKNYNLTVERFVAIDGKELKSNEMKLPSGVIGILRSDLAIIKNAKQNNYKNILIFEDDIEFSEDFNQKFDEYIKQIPEDWSFIYLGGNNKRPATMISENAKKIDLMYSAYAVIIRQNVYNELIEEISKEQKQVDLIFASLQKKYPSYMIYPYLVWVRNDYSDINERFIDVSYLKKDKYEKSNRTS